MIQHLKTIFSKRYAKKIVFRDVARCDGFALFTATQNPEFNKHLLWPAPSEENSIFLQIDKLIREHTLNNAVILSVCDRYSGTWMGLARLQYWKDGIEMGLYLHPETWSRGVVFASGGALLETLVEQFPDLPIYIRMRPGNEKMKRLTDYYHFELEPDKAQEIHAIEGAILLDVYRLRKHTRIPYPHISHY